MKIKLGMLRTMIREEVERNVRWNAGFGINGMTDSCNVDPPPGLGQTQEDEQETEHEKEEAQIGRRVRNREHPR